MKTFLILVQFFGSLFILFAIGWLIGHFLKLDKYYEEIQNEIKSKNRKK